MVRVLFKVGLEADYQRLKQEGRLQDNALYYITDTQRMYKGNLLMGVGKEASTVAAGLLSPEDKALLDSLTSNLDKKVDKELIGPNGVSKINQEADGAYIQFVNNDGTQSAVSIHDGGKDNIAAQVYAVDKDTLKGAKLDVTTNGIFYTTGDESGKAASERDIAANELITRKDLVEVEVPEYSMRKDENPGDYAAIYHLTKDGIDIGEAINIAKDQLLKSVEIKTCTKKDEPISGLMPGDKYMDFTFIVEKGEEVHTYIAIKDMVKPYTAGEGIVITSENAITYDPEVIASVEYVDANISDTMNFIIQERDAEHAGRVAGDELLQAAIDAEIARAKAEEAKKTVEHISGTNGESYVWNESTGGGSRFVNKNGVESFIGVNDGTNGLVAQIYADKLVDGKWQGAKLDVANGGMYYTVGNKLITERMVEANEIATKGDIEAAALEWGPIA